MGETGRKGQFEFWFDFSSPYAFFAAQTVKDVARRHDLHLVWRPFMLGVAFKATGMQSLSNTPIRGDYARHDWVRLARRLQVSFKLPSNHPIVALPASRIFYWLEERDEVAAGRFARRAFDAYFVEGTDMARPEGAAAEAAKVSPFSVAELAAAASEPAIKDKLKARTQEALDRGIFGSPFFVVAGEPFWGADRLPMVEEWLASGGW